VDRVLEISFLKLLREIAVAEEEVVVVHWASANPVLAPHCLHYAAESNIHILSV
jgi:hypothetical protein